MGLDFVAISFETANDLLGSVCAVGLVRIRNGVMVDRFSSFVSYPRSLGGFDAKNTDRHGIIAKDLIGAPVWTEVLPKITNFIGDDYVVAHKAADLHMQVIVEASEEAGVPLPNLTYFCSLQLSKRAVPELSKYRLVDVDGALELGTYTTHDTEANAYVTAMICVEIAERAELDSLTHVMGQYAVREGTIGLGREFATEEKVAVTDVEEVTDEAPVAPKKTTKVAVAESPVAQVEEPKKATEPAVAASSDGESPLLSAKGQRISFVGGFDLADRTAAKERIAEQGGKYLKNVRADTTLLVIGVHINPDLEGIVAARSFNAAGSKIRMMSKEEFFSAIGL